MLEGLKVYVSSTSVDLKEYRAAVIAALRKSGFFPVCMEDYVAQDKLPVDKCLADVEQCDLYVGIFAWRYGYVPAGHEKSITELEYRRAVEKSIPALIFLVREDVDWPSEFCDTRQDAARISALKDEFKLGKMVGWFTANPHQLASEVQAAVNQHERVIQRARIEKLMAGRYAEVSVADTPEQKASMQQAIALVQEAMRQQSLQAQQTTREPIPVSIPKLRGTFVDREVERDTLYHSLRQANKSLVVIVAPGGYGKTELTTKVLKEIAPDRSIIADDIQGLLYLRCVRGEITLGQIFSEAGRIAGRKQEFCDTYASKEMTLSRKLEFFFGELSKTGNVWLVMDNFEDLLNAGDDSIKDEELREFFEIAVAVEHNVRIIVTSRAVPKFKGSRSAEKIDLSAGLPEDQAIRYLRAEGREYGLAEEDEEVLRTFVKRVHCIPKALESILGYLEDHFSGGMTLRNILADERLFVDFDKYDLENGLKRLVSQQYAIQSPDAQLVLSALSIFPKPVSNTALRYLLQGISSAEFAGLLTRLEKNRLVSQNNGYYDMHPVVRSFVYGRIPDETPGGGGSGGDEKKEVGSGFTKARLHHKAAEFFKELRSPRAESKTISDLEPHLQEIHHLMKAGEYDAAARVLNIIDFDYLRLWGHPKVVIELREQLAGKLRSPCLIRENSGSLGLAIMHTGRVSESIAYFEEALLSAKEYDDKVSFGTWIGNLGIAWTELGEPRKAIKCHEQGLVISRENGNKHKETSDLGNLGCAWLDLGETRKAIEYHEQALAISREIGSKLNEELDLDNLGNAWAKLGETRKAIEYYVQALAISRETGNKSDEGIILGNLGSAWARLGETRKAIEYFELALVISREIGDKLGDGIILGNLGSAWARLGETKKAIEYHEQALAITREIGNKWREGSVLNNLGLVWSDLGETKKAIEIFKQGLAIAKETGDRNLEGLSLSLIGSQYICLDQIGQARKNLESALLIAQETGYRYGESSRLGNIALTDFLLLRDSEAIESYAKALVIAREMARPELSSEILNGIAFLQHCLHDSRNAEALYRESLDLNISENSFIPSVLLGILQLELGNQYEAGKNLALGLSLCQVALTNTPKLYEAFYKLALCQLAMGKGAEAIGSYKGALATCNAKGVVKMALRELEVLERASPDLPGLDESRKLLADSAK